MLLRSISMTMLATVAALTATDVALGAGSASLSGVVSDSAGKPVHGAIVRVEQGDKLIARYTTKEGRYRIDGLTPQPKKITVTAFGFAAATLQADGDQANVKLAAGASLADLTSAELRYLVNDNDKSQRHVYYECGNCHGLELLVSRAGMPAAAWAGFLPHMTGYRWGENYFSPERSAVLASWIEPMFGPEGTLGPRSKPDYSKIKHTPLDDAALAATITEYVIPSPGAQPHSVRVDQKSGAVWFGNYDSPSTNIYRFEPRSETFKEYEIPLVNAAAHTGVVLKDGSFIVGLDRRKTSPLKMAWVTSDEQVRMFEWPGRPRGGRVITRDPTNADVIWVVSGSEIWRVNLQTNERRAYQNPHPATLPKGSFAEEFAWPGDQPHGGGYDVAVDSKGTVWVSQLLNAVLFSIEPESGQTRMYHTPEMKSTRGIGIDADDNVWFADFYGHKLGMLEPRTGKVTLYQPPSKYASPYGLSMDTKRGYLWYADTMANSATRFDLKTKKFVEYPLPTSRAFIRFMGLDDRGRAWYGGFGNSKLGVIDPGDAN